MDSQEVFLVPQAVAPASSNVYHQQQQTTTHIVQQQQIPQCSICGTTQKLLRCAKCKAIYYCSTDHQHLDWPTHKQECRALAKQRQINNRLQQLTNGCGAMNINAHAKSNNSSAIEIANWNSNYPSACCGNIPRSNLKSNTFVLGTHENEILNSKAEIVTQNSSSSDYMGSFDANSTTTDQMHNIIVHNCIDSACIHDESNQTCKDNSYYQPMTTKSNGKSVNKGTQDCMEQTEHSGGDTPQQESCRPAQLLHQQQVVYPPQQQTTLQYPVPQLSNHLINQQEKSSSYQIGAAAIDDTLFENANERRYEELCRNIINDMNQYGLSVVDDFLGREKGLQILNEVHKMYSAGVFKDGQLVNNMKAEQDLRTIRGDKITWVKGVEPGCSNVGYLINQIDAVICRANSMRNNGKLGNYIIKERTKAMVACYPGSGSHYVMHVDNPNKDGRVITAIYYLNLNWDSRNSGGVLRIFPEQTKSVADIEPKFDRLIFFWSDKRNPHEVQPAHKTRYAITVWYFDANERELALNRCRTLQSSSNLNNINSASNSHTNENNTTNKSTSAPHTTQSSTLSPSSTNSSAITPALQTTYLSKARLLTRTNLKNLATTPDTLHNLNKPIQVVLPKAHK